MTLLNNVLVGDGCWEWQGVPASGGYGQAHLRNGKQSKHMRVNRMMWEWYNGRALEDDELVLHTCNNKKCVRPKHLYIGTQRDNMKDRKNAGHYAVGGEHPMAKLSCYDVWAIRHMHRDGISQKELARRFNTDQTNVSLIVRGKTWAQ